MRPRGPLFLERETYRRRRVMDAGRILPVAGFVAILLPVLWARGDGSGIAREAVYLFVVWAVLVLAAALLSRPLGNSYNRAVNPAVTQPPAPRQGPATDEADAPHASGDDTSRQPSGPAGQAPP